MSRAVAKIDDKQIADMDLEISFRMKVSEWREFMRYVPTGHWPSTDMGRHISAVLDHVSRSTEMVFTNPKHEAD